MSTIDVPLKNGGFGRTARTDGWWVEPLLVFLGYMSFIVYATWAGMQGNNYELAGTNYLSPMYSPVLMRTAPGRVDSPPTSTIDAPSSIAALVAIAGHSARSR